MTEETEEPKRTRARAKPAEGAGAKPRRARAKAAATGGQSPIEEKVEKLADEAVEAGRKLLETDAGKKVADAAGKAFETAEDVGREAKAKAEELARKALESETGREAREAAKAVWATPVGRNVAIGAGAGAALGLVVPIVGPFIGALVGGGLGYLRTITRKG